MFYVQYHSTCKIIFYIQTFKVKMHFEHRFIDNLKNIKPHQKYIIKTLIV